MNESKISNKPQNEMLKKRGIYVLVGIIAILILVFITIQMSQPQRTVANFCRYAKEEKSNFKASTSYDKLLAAFKRLDRVAPEDIHSDTSIIVNGYESIVSDPSKAISAELGISSSQMKVSGYITKNCPDY